MIIIDVILAILYVLALFILIVLVIILAIPAGIIFGFYVIVKNLFKKE